jgi:electron transport complex protein RnfD
VKQLYGGIGKNFLNPALAARAFLFSWPVIMTTWMAPRSYGSLFNLGADAVTSATPMASLHAGVIPDVGLTAMFLGDIGGSIGEVSAAALLLGGIYLVVRKVISCRIPVTFILTVAVITSYSPKAGTAISSGCFTTYSAAALCLGPYSWPPITRRARSLPKGR